MCLNNGITGTQEAISGTTQQQQEQQNTKNKSQENKDKTKVVVVEVVVDEGVSEPKHLREVEARNNVKKLSIDCSWKKLQSQLGIMSLVGRKY